jgi:hypothetical protein
MERTFARSRWFELGCAGFIVALAAWLRLRELGLAEFKLDELTAVALARRLMDGHLPTVGLQSSVGALNPPFFIYATALPLSISDDPLAATAFVGVLAAAAVGVTYVVLRPRFGALAALAAAALFATGPWAVLYGRKIWAQDLLPIFTVSLLWALLVVVERRRTRAVLLVPVLVCLAFQLNFSALALVVPAGLVLLYRGRDVHWPAFGLGVVAAVLLLGPWLGHEAGNGFADVGKLLSGGRGDPGSALVSSGVLEAVRQTVHILGVGNWDYVVGGSHAQLADEAGTAWRLAAVAGAAAFVLLAVGLVTCAVRVVRGGRLTRWWPFVELGIPAARRALLLAWLAGIWLSYATSARDRVFPHYLIVTYPVSFAVAALGLSDLVELARPRFRAGAVAVGVGALALVVAGFVAFTVSFHRFLARHGGANGDYGVVYDDSHAVAQLVRARGLRVGNDQAVDFLASGHLDAPRERSGVVTTETRFDGSAPSPCAGELRTFRALSVCLPPP